MKLKPLTGERQKKESNNAVVACNDYLRMGPGRSLVSLLDKYTRINQDSPPTRSEGTLKQWSSRFNWQERAVAFDAQWEEYKNEERRKVFNTELALDYERVVKLNRLGNFLEEQLFEQGEDGKYHNIWLPDVKVVGSGEFATAVDIERFNQGIIREYREILSDLAAETGGRIKKQEITGERGGPFIIKVIETND